MNVELSGEQGKDTSIYFTRLYIIALSTIALLTIAGQLLVQRSLNHRLIDSYTVNRAGRQRMLSQKICKLALLIQYGKDDSTKAMIKELRETVSVWEQFHNGLFHGNTKLNLYGDNSAEVNEIFTDIEPYFQEMLRSAKAIPVSTSSNELPGHVQNILEYEGRFLNGMEFIVGQFEVESREKVAVLKKVESLLFSMTLLVLLLEGLFIFRPAAKKIRESYERLKKINSKLEQKVKERTEELFKKNRELKLKNNELSKINKDLDTFVYTTSHDLKAPISNIEGLVTVLAEEIQSDDNSQPIIDMIRQSIQKFKTLLQDLSIVGKIKQQSVDENLLVKFKDMLEEVEFNLHEQIEHTGAVIFSDFSKAPSIKFSRKNLRSILHNLLSNAVKFRSPERTPEIKISTEVFNDNYILLKVTDNGMGIKEEDKGKLFSIYERLHEDIEGTGVGLNIIRQIIDNNGGYIIIDSEVGKGSTFNVYIKI
jgi:signal transduction histidine kinase